MTVRFTPSLPAAPIYRYLGEAQFARNFQMGWIRVSTLRKCRETDDAARRDAGEGNRRLNARTVLGDREGLLEVVFDIQSDVTVEHAFVLCFSERNDRFIRGRFGQFGVEVSEPVRLFDDLTKAIAARGFRVVLSTASRICYRERTFVGRDLSPPLTEFLKPPVPFAEEREVRFVWRLVADPRVEWLDLVLPEPPPGCRVLDEFSTGDPSGHESPSG